MRGSLALAGLLVFAPRSALAQRAPAPAEGDAGGVTIAQRRAVPANVVVADPAALLWGAALVRYERAFTPSFSLNAGLRLQVMPSPVYLGGGGFLEGSGLGFGAGVEVGARVYSQGFAPQGFFFGLQASFLWQSDRAAATPERQESVGHVQFGPHLGYQWVVARVLVLSVDGGFEFVLRDGSVVQVAFPLGLAVGVAF